MSDQYPLGEPTNRAKPEEPKQQWFPTETPGVFRDNSKPPRLKTWLNTDGKPMKTPPGLDEQPSVYGIWC